MIEAEELARCRSYDWVVRLRPDVAYTCRLPTIEEWPPFRRASARAPKAHRPRPPWVLSDWIFVENYTTRSVAVKDVWAVMDRSAASVYMRDWPRKCGCNGEHGINEEDLGCTLSQGRVEVGAQRARRREHIHRHKGKFVLQQARPVLRRKVGAVEAREDSVDGENRLDRVVDGVERDHDGEDVDAVPTHPQHEAGHHERLGGRPRELLRFLKLELCLINLLVGKLAIL